MLGGAYLRTLNGIRVLSPTAYEKMGKPVMGMSAVVVLAGIMMSAAALPEGIYIYIDYYNFKVF